MSKLGKILLYVALAGAVVAIGAGFALTQKYSATQASLAQTQEEKAAADKATSQANQKITEVTQEKTDSDNKLTAANSKINDLNSQLEKTQKEETDAAAAAQKAGDDAKTAQDSLDAITKTLNGRTAADITASEAKAEADLTAAQSEQKILQDQLQAAQSQVADLRDEINRSQKGTMPPGISGKVTFVDHTWNFVVLDVGLSNGVVPNGELIVYRGRNFLGKIRVTKADPNDAVAEILPDIKGDIQIGDSVLN